ncbi:MAG: MaoC/PaaZ C-terminal domain-containing protein [Micropruina sp.]|uniref:MaoC family dehydratase n=1 Tax=Micropruina sp. TaxID=2737536 RepID=UPI0039E27DC2
MSDVVVLDGMPTATGQYARALSPRARPPAAAGLPDRVVHLLHHRCEIAEVAAYNQVCGFTLTDRLPATWLHVLTFPLQLTLMTAPDFPLAPLGMVHVSNTLTQVHPVSITEPMELTVHADALRPHRRGVLVDLVGEVLVAGEPVWTGRSTYLNRSASLAAGSRQAQPTEPDEARPTTTGEARPADDQARTAVADLPTAGLWRLQSDLGRRYAAVSGDVNPIHLNPLAAKAFGLPGMIAHGMWTHARALAAFQPRLPDSFQVSVRFSKPVRLPSTVRFAAATTDGGLAAQLTNRAADKVFLTMDVTGR